MNTILSNLSRRTLLKQLPQIASLFVLATLVLTALLAPMGQAAAQKNAQAVAPAQPAQLQLVVQASGGTIQLVTPVISLRSTVNPAFNSLLPTGGYAAGTAYVLDTSGVPKVVAVDALGTRELTFIKNPSPYGLAVWQGSSTSLPRLAWGTQATSTTRSTSLQISAVDGSKLETLLTEAADNIPLQLTPEFWSADGKTLYFSKEPVGLGGYILFGGASNLYQIDLATKKVTEVLPPGAAGAQVCLDAISGDLRYLADHCSQKSISVRDLVSGGTTTIQAPREASLLFQTLGSARFSPDGRRLAFALAKRNPDSEQGWVAVSDGISGGSKLVLTSKVGSYYTVTGWLDDQTLLIQAENLTNCGQSCGSELWAVGVDGKNLQKVADGRLLAVINNAVKTYVSEKGLYSLVYPSTAIFYENQHVSVDGVVSPAVNTISIQEFANGGAVLSLTHYALPAGTTLAYFARSEKECAGIATLPGLSFILQGRSALLFPDTRCGPYGTTYIYTMTGNMGYRFTIETSENYFAARRFTDPILNSFQTLPVPGILPTPQPPLPTPIPIPCNQAAFVKDVTVKDGTLFARGVDFTKTWRLENTGSCTWTKDYDLVFRNGDQMDGPNAVAFDEEVRPGDTIDLSVDLTAPAKAGKYTGYWALRDEAGRIFGIGAGAKNSFWVNIEVTTGNELVYDFTADFCDATWSTSTMRDIPCSSLVPGAGGLPLTGGVFVNPSPRLETGYVDNEPALVTSPDGSLDGYIRGRYPEITIEDGDHFKTIIGCMYDSWDCNVTLTLSYSINGGETQQLGRWTESYDNDITRIDIDLSFLAGKKVEFIFTTRAKGTNEPALAFWLAPRILR